MAGQVRPSQAQAVEARGGGPLSGSVWRAVVTSGGSNDGGSGACRG